MQPKSLMAACVLGVVVLSGPAVAGQFVTETFGNNTSCSHQGTLTVQEDIVRFDLTAIPRSSEVYRAVLRVPSNGHENGQSVHVVAVDLAGAKRLSARPPLYNSFDATQPAKAWVANPAANKGLAVEKSGGVEFNEAVLEVSYSGEAKGPAKQVTDLKALHQAGQTFLTWKEIEDVVGADSPQFVDFEKNVLDARTRRDVAYRVYRHSSPITVESLGRAELVAEIPEALSCWNLNAIRNTEHPNQGTPTKRSALRPGYNLALNHMMGRYRIAGGGEPLPRSTGLTVLTVREPGRFYYAVTSAINGAESVDELGSGAVLSTPVDEKPSRFPATIYQRTNSAKEGSVVSAVDVYNSWLEPPYHNVPIVSETFIVRWKRLEKGNTDNRLPLWLNHGHYGGTASSMGSPGWYGAREYVKGALTIGITEGSLWQGFHECIGTLRGYEDGVVHNYPQRRVLGAAHWAIENEDFYVDPQRVSLYGQFGWWALRHGDLFAAVMSNGHANMAIGKQSQNHGWKWGPYPEGSKNWLGIDQWEHMNLPKWIRENPTVELPFWICHPAYGAYPSHSIGDFGFMPWPEMLHAMASTKRAFAANWSSNGPGPVGPLYDLVTRIELHQSLPAFTDCSLDHSPGDGDHADAEKGGGINIHQRWDPETIVDEPGKWEITLFVQPACPRESLTTDLTPRRCQKFKPQPGEKYKWQNAAGDRVLQAGEVTADQWGLVTVPGVRITKTKSRIRISK
ncbi:MAG: hypothetical protein V3R99_00340 [Thermoguttaceae bacterium]